MRHTMTIVAARPRRAGVACAGIVALSACGATSAGNAVWEPGGTLPAPKQHAFGLNASGTLYSIGGPPWASGGDQDGSVFVKSGASWIEGMPLDGMGPIIPQGGGVDGLGRIIVFGGIVLDSGDAAPNVVYDPVEGPMGEIAGPGDFVEQAGFAFAADASGRLYWLGGGGGSAGGNSSYCERYTAPLDAWQPIAPLPVAVGEACACDDGAGHILVFGGFVASGSARTVEVQRFDVAAGTWSTTAVPDMPEAVSGARAVLGADDRVYVIGGVGGAGAGTVRAGVLVLSLASNSWSSGPPLATARHEFAAARGSDDRIYAIGGTGAGGAALDSVEMIFTPTCPTVSGPPALAEPWLGETIVLAAPVGGSAPMSFAWLKDGAPLADGPTGSGSAISGAATATLIVTNGGPADAGAYEISATNDCGTVQAVVATVSMRSPAAIPRLWTAVSLHPDGAISSTCSSVSGDRQGGAITITHPEYTTMSVPVRWMGSAPAMEQLTPPSSVGGAVTDVEGDMSVGWWWWPYQCYQGGQWYTCYSRQAARWVGGAAGFDNLQASGWEYSVATAVRGGIVGGTVTNDDEVGNVWSHGGLWEPPAYNFRDLHPGAVASSSFLSAIDGDHQFGSIHTPFPAPSPHAAMWSGSAASFVDMHPGGYAASGISDARDGQQVGSVGYYSDAMACLWSGSRASWRSLHPAGAERSWAAGCAQGLQFGGAVFGGATHLLVWSGSPDSYVDLTGAMPPGITSFSASGADVRDDGSIAVAGAGYVSAEGRWEAMLLIGAPGVPGDADGDGDVDFADLLIVLSAWGPCPAPCASDLDGDGSVGFADLLVVLSSWSP